MNSFQKIRASNKIVKPLCRGLRVLGIESSCDDTSAGVVTHNRQILAEGHFSQSRLHIEAGGILPTIAAHLHREKLKHVVETCMNQSTLDFKDLDAIAVTTKPGLFMSLLAGLEYAKDLCAGFRKPLIPIHHMEAHALTPRLKMKVEFPFLALLISGGHCILSLVESVDKFYTLGKTKDSSPGQALDRVARKMKLKNLKKYRMLVGGAAIELAAKNGDPTKINFPVNLMRNEFCNFSFSGLWTFAENYIKKQEKLLDLQPDQILPNYEDLCASFQWAITKHICQKLDSAIQYLEENNMEHKCVVVSGGVASNSFITEAIKFVCDHHNYKLIVPPPKLCTDNGLMVAWNGVEKLKENLSVVTPENLETVSVEPKCELGESIEEKVQETLRIIKKPNLKMKDFIRNFANKESLDAKTNSEKSSIN